MIHFNDVLQSGAGVGLGLGTVPLSTADNDKNIRGAGRKPVFDKKLEVMESMQMFSTLANELRMIYHGLIGRQRTTLIHDKKQLHPIRSISL